MTDPDLQEEIGRLEAQLEAHPGSLLFARLADLVRKDGDPGRALEILGRGLEDHPEYLSAHIVRARALEDLGRRIEAEDAYRRVLDLDDRNLVALDALARAAEGRDDRDAAVSWYERLLAVDPRNEEAEARLEALREPAAEEALGEGAVEEEPPTPAPGEGPAAGEGLEDGPVEEGGFEDEAFEDEPAVGVGEPEPHDAFGVEPGEEIRSARWPWEEEPELDAAGEPGLEAEEEPEPEPEAGSDEIVAFSRDASGVESDEEVGSGSAEDVEDPFSGWGAVPIDDEGDTDAEDLEPAAEEQEPPMEPAAEEQEPPPQPAAEEPPAPEDEEPGSASEWEEPEPEPAPEWEELEARGEDLVAEWEASEPEDLEAEIEELSEGWDEPDGEEPEGDLDDDSDLPTETLANLYVSQGLYREAVTIYEDLVRRRPHDEALLERLRAAREELGEDVREPADDLEGEKEAAEAVPHEPGEAGVAAGGPGEAGEGRALGGGADGADAPEPSMREHLLALLRGEAVPDGPAGGDGA